MSMKRSGMRMALRSAEGADKERFVRTMEMKIKDICTSVTDGSHNPPQGIVNSKYIMLSSKNVFDDKITFDEPRFLSEEDFKKEHKRTKVSVGDVLLTIVGTVGRTAVVDEDMPLFALQRSVAVLHPKTDDCLPRFLMYALRGKRTFIENRAKGVAQKGIYLKDVSDIDVQVPDISTQEMIINQLDKVDTIVKFRKEELLALDNLIKARFVEMFGDESNPLRWDVVNVEDVATVQVGVVIKPAQYYTDAANGVRAFRSLNIGPMNIKDNDWVYFSEEGNSKNAKSILKENDLLIVRSGAPGTACVVTKQYAGCNAIDIIIAHPDMNKVNPYYLCAYTNLPHGKRQIDEGTGGAAQQHFNVGKYNKLQLMLPPIEKQEEFVLFMEQVNKSKF